MAQEHLSALLDGECSEAELDRLLDEMERNPALKHDWSRLCRNRDAAAGTRLRTDPPCICDGVMSQLEAPTASGQRVVDLASRRGRMIWKPLAGLAAAASVAAVAFLAGLNVTTGHQDSMEAAQPVYGAQQVADNTRDEDLDRYLMEHNNRLAEQGMGGGTLGYARLASYVPGEGP